jgi:hypothetical protein
MSMSLIVPAADHRPGPTLIREPSAPLDGHDPSMRRDPPGGPPAIVEVGADDGPGSPPNRRHAAAMIRQLGSRSEVALRRELNRFFAARPGLSPAERVAIARAMSRFRNQLLHHPRSTLRAAADADHPAGSHTLLDAVRNLFGLTEAPQINQPGPRTTGQRPARSG